MPNQSVTQTALKLLAQREHSRLELQQKLLAKGFPADTVTTILDRLQTDKLLDEIRFAEAYIRSRINKGYGWLRIQQELQQRGIDADTMEAGLAALDTIDWSVLARQAHAKKFATAPTEPKEKAKQIRFLLSRGFGHAEIRAVLNEESIDL